MKRVKNYKVDLKITDYSSFEVTADDLDEATEKAKEMYIENLKAMLPRYSFEEVEVEDYEINYDYI